MKSSDAVPFLRRALTVARAEFAALGALAVVTLGIMTFIEIADDVTEADGQAFDQRVLYWMQPAAGQPRGPWWLHEAAADITSLGGIAVLTLFAFVALGMLLILRKRLSAVLLVVGLAGGVGLSEGLKALFERERPPAAFQAVETLNASFPSGHALLSTVFYLTVAVMMTRAFPKRRLKAYVLGVGIVFALMVGLTRVYLGAHWASDVMAGWCVGAAWAMALWLVSYAVERRQKRHHAHLVDDPPVTSETALAEG
ncbi:phosphatase PAP2 family protein [Brevundimonas sp.]|uniref:phosphatase PAP2 family protein n=1 Tax=Brevundimonas sp. TaxID=1871086 RepID=UPI00286B8422|nr:phosphatase PAP2 family protein [Brevundimonas sp.]